MPQEEQYIAILYYYLHCRGSGDASNASKFVTTIAVQLASNILPLRPHIYDAVTKNINITSRRLADQWRQIVFGPLSKLDGSATYPSYIVVIDALDECDDGSDIEIILRQLAEIRSLNKIRLRVLITSQPEVRIQHEFRKILHAEHRLLALSPQALGQSITTPRNVSALVPTAKPRGCFIIIALFASFVILSLFLGVYFTLKKENGYSMGDSFTLAGYVIAVGTVISAPILAYHYPHCKCWQKYKENYTHIEMEPLVP